MTTKAVIFDFDGIIVDSERVKFKRLSLLLKTYNVILKKNDFRAMIGKKTGAFLKQKFSSSLSSKEMAAISRARRKDQTKNIRLYSRPITGVKRFIGFLHQKKLLICIATGTKRSIVKKTLQIIQLQKYFGAIVTGLLSRNWLTSRNWFTG